MVLVLGKFPLAARAVKESAIFNVLEGLYANGISQALRVWKFGCFGREVLPSYAAVPILDFVEVEWQVLFGTVSFYKFHPPNFWLQAILEHLSMSSSCQVRILSLFVDRSIHQRSGFAPRSVAHPFDCFCAW